MQHITLLQNTWFWLGAYWVFSAAVSTMPAPDDKSSNGYKWAFNFMHTLAGSVARITPLVGAKNPAIAKLLQSDDKGNNAP